MCDDERRYKLGEKIAPDPDERCCSCDTQVAELQVYEYPVGHMITQQLGGYSRDPDQTYTIEEILTLCDFCASTFCSKAVSYPGQVNGDIAHAMAATAHSHNLIMHKLAQGGAGAGEAFVRLAAAAEKAADALARFADTYERVNAELGDDLPLEECDECGITHAASELFKTTWDQKVCRTCWSSVTNDAPLPDDPDPT
jgi:hypothetical protein